MYPGLWESSVTRHVLSGETYEKAAYRELEEELGLTKLKLEKITDFKNFSEIERQWSRLYTAEYYGTLKLNGEAVRGKYLPFEEVVTLLKKKKLTPGSMLALQEFLSYKKNKEWENTKKFDV